MVEFGDVEDLVGVEVARVILIDLLEACIQFLDFCLGELARKLCISH